MTTAEKKDLAKRLLRWIPEGAVPEVLSWFDRYSFHLKIKRPRKSILGDYRPPFKGKGNRISINSDLNPFSFLITFGHEIAHLIVWEKHRNQVLPHGVEWKNAFKQLMQIFLEQQLFPKDIDRAFRLYLKNPAAGCVDTRLYKVLRSYDKPKVGYEDVVLVETLKPGDRFRINNGQVFEMKRKLRKRYLCTELTTGREFSLSPIAEAKKVFPEKKTKA